MTMRRYQVTLTGSAPLLMSYDNIEWADKMKRWQDDPRNQKDSIRGDDRSPAWSWIGRLYKDAEDRHPVLPCDNIMRMLMEGGAMVPVPGARNSATTFKRQSQSGIMVGEVEWPIVVAGKPVDLGPVLALKDNKDFDKHSETANKAGFILFVKRAKVGQSKHVRVRPRFDRWSASGTLVVTDDKITTDVLKDILSMGGTYKGLGDWRPSSPKSPGPFGRFSATVKEVEK